MTDLIPIIKIAGVAISSFFTEKLLEHTGHGDKTNFVRIVSYIVCAAIALDEVWDHMRVIGGRFGIYI